MKGKLTGAAAVAVLLGTMASPVVAMAATKAPSVAIYGMKASETVSAQSLNVKVPVTTAEYAHLWLNGKYQGGHYSKGWEYYSLKLKSGKNVVTAQVVDKKGGLKSRFEHKYATYSDEATTVASVKAISGTTGDLSLVSGHNTAQLQADNAAGNPLTTGITWTSSNSSVASVSSNGQVVAVSAGTATITATDANGKTATYNVTVIGQAAAIQLSAASSNLVADGQYVTVTAKVVDSNGSTVSNYNGTATVDASGEGNAFTVPLSTDTKQSSSYKNGTLTFTNGVATLVVKASTDANVSGKLAVTSTGVNEVQNSDGTAATSSLTLNTVAQQATSLSVSPENKYVSVNSNPGTQNFDVQVLDQAGQPMLTGSYAFTATVSGSGQLGAGSSSFVYNGNNDPSNVVQVPVTVSTGNTGAITVSVSSTGLTGASATESAVIAQNASKFSITPATNDTTSFTEAASTTLDVAPVDVNGYAAVNAASVPGTFTVTATNAKGQTASNIVINGNDGVYNNATAAQLATLTVSDTKAGADAGSYTLTIKDSNGNVWGTVGLTETAAAANTLVVTPAASELSVANPATSLNIGYTDTYGNAAAAPSGVIKFTVTTSLGEGTATINGQNATAPGLAITPSAAGTATVQFSAQPYAGSDWTVTATDGTYTGQVVLPIKTALVSSASVSMKDAGTQNTSITTDGSALAFTFGAKDSYGNAYTGSDTFTVSYKTGALKGVSNASTHAVLTSANGTDTVTDTLAGLAQDFANATANTTGSLSVSIADASVSAASGSGSINVVPGAFAGYALFDASGNQAVLGENVTKETPVELWVKPVDGEGNPTGQVIPTSGTVDLTSSSATGVFRLSANGTSLVNNQLSVTAGSYSVPVYYVDSATGTPVLSAGAQAEKTATLTGVPTTTVTASTAYTISGVLKDQAGNPMAGTVYVTVSNGHGATVTSTAVTASSTGAFTFTYTSGTATVAPATASADTITVSTAASGGTTLAQATTAAY